MFCFRIKKRLYDFLEGNLSEPEAETIRAHLEGCGNCAKRYGLLRSILESAAQRRAPELSSEFWADFDRGLKEKLAREKVAPQEIRLRPQYARRISLKPAFALATAAVLLIAFSFYLFGGLPTKERLYSLADEQLVSDIEVIEELMGEYVGFEEQNLILNELVLLESLS